MKIPPATLAALARKHMQPGPGFDEALMGSVLVNCEASLADLVAAMLADGQADAAERVRDIVAATRDTNWLALAAVWNYMAAPPAGTLADLLRAQHAPPANASIGDVAIADGEHWNPLGIGWCIVRFTAKGWGLL